MCLCHCFHTVRNQLTGCKRIFHTDMSHGDTIAHTDGRHHNRGTAGHADSRLDRFCDFIQMKMPRNNLGIGADHTDQRLIQFFFCQSQCIEQRTLRCTGISSNDRITWSTHIECLLIFSASSSFYAASRQPFPMGVLHERDALPGSGSVLRPCFP